MITKIDIRERDIYAQICSNDGIKARDIAKNTGIDRSAVNRYLYGSPFMRDLCYVDSEYRWHGLIRQKRPHTGLGDYAGYYGLVPEFMALGEDDWFGMLREGCRRNGRNLNDTRGLFHSFKDSRLVVRSLFQDLSDAGVDTSSWEVLFELRLRRSKMIRIYADVLVITDRYVFSLEFKMKDVIEPEEVAQAAKYAVYQEVLFGPSYEIIPVLVLTAASDLYTYVPIGNSTAQLPVCAGDMLFNIFDEYLGFLEE